MNILIYYPYNLRSVEQQSVMEMLVKTGHKVVLLTTCPAGPLHKIVEEYGVIAVSTAVNSENSLTFYYENLKNLWQTVKKYNIEVVIAHQQKPGLIAGILSGFLSFRLFYFRHNTDEDYHTVPLKAKFLNKLVNYLTVNKVAPSDIVFKFWTEIEKQSPQKIERINYGYNFNQYEKPDLTNANKIREQFQSPLLIISMARMVPAKRHVQMFEVVKCLMNKNVPCKMICLGSGPLKEKLEVSVKEMNLEKNIFFIGRKDNIFDYIHASDIFLHLSTAEASNNAVKEVALCKKPVIVCKDVGDFNEYIVDNYNSFMVDKENPVPEACRILDRIYHKEVNAAETGEKLYETVINKFSINKVESLYQHLINFNRTKTS